MKSSLLRFLVLIYCLLSGVWSASALETVAVWEASDVNVRSADVVWPDSKGGHDLRGQTVQGISSGKKDGIGSASRTVEFNGEQSVPLRTVNPFPPVLESLQVEVLMSLAEGSLEESGTVVRVGTQWELRAEYKRKGLSFIVWHDKDHYTNVFLPVQPGDWVEVVATMSDGILRLKVGDAEQQVQMKGDLRLEETAVPLAVGATKSFPQDGSEFRPFAGAIQSLKISM